MVEPGVLWKCCKFTLAALLRFTGVQDGAYFAMRQTPSTAIGDVF